MTLGMYIAARVGNGPGPQMGLRDDSKRAQNLFELSVIILK